MASYPFLKRNWTSGVLSTSARGKRSGLGRLSTGLGLRDMRVSLRRCATTLHLPYCVSLQLSPPFTPSCDVSKLGVLNFLNCAVQRDRVHSYRMRQVHGRKVYCVV